MNKENHRKLVPIYLSSEEKALLESKAKVNEQGLSRYIRNVVLRRISKVPISEKVVADRVLLSKLKSSVILLSNIASEVTETPSKNELLNELQSLTNIIDSAIIKSMVGKENDSSNISES